MSIALLAALTVVLTTGCGSSAETGPLARLAAELPPELWSAIESEFAFDEEMTERLRAMNTDLLTGYPEEFEIEWWGFAYEGSVAEAFAALPAPAEGTSVEPFETTLADLLASHLTFWEEELVEHRDAAWHEEAVARSAEWADRTQTVAEFGVATGSLNEAEQTSWSELFEAADGNPELTLSTWMLSVVSPIVDLERLEIVEGTYLIVQVMDASY